MKSREAGFFYPRANRTDLLAKSGHALVGRKGHIVGYIRQKQAYFITLEQFKLTTTLSKAEKLTIILPWVSDKVQHSFYYDVSEQPIVFDNLDWSDHFYSGASHSSGKIKLKVDIKYIDVMTGTQF